MNVFSRNKPPVILYLEEAMAENGQEQAMLRLAGYAALIDRYGFEVIPNWHRSLAKTSGIHRIDSTEDVIEEVYPPKYWPGNTLGDHLEFALKYDGTNLALLQLAEREDFCEKAKLIDLQNRVVGPRFSESDYLANQNYVGETVAWQKEKIHFACPKPEDLLDLMEGLIAAHKRMDERGVSAVAHAAAVAYGFVFLHPFEGNNGRIHRFLIHNVLARRGFTPEGIMFPVSAFMLKNLADYDASLEAFSRPLMALVEYSIDEEGRMTVHNDTARWYSYIDMTSQAEALFRFIEQTINTELVNELEFLANYDKTKRAIQEIVDMPDRQIDIFIRFCLQNNGRLSARKRASYFGSLLKEEIARMEQAVQSAYGSNISDDK